jgi:hypothetical protein
MSTDTASTSTDATTAGTAGGEVPAPAEPIGGRNNFLLRVGVVLVAIGLLVALFRASR